MGEQAAATNFSALAWHVDGVLAIYPFGNNAGFVLSNKRQQAARLPNRFD